MDVPTFINIAGTCPPCPIGIDAPVPWSRHCRCERCDGRAAWSSRGDRDDVRTRANLEQQQQQQRCGRGRRRVVGRRRPRSTGQVGPVQIRRHARRRLPCLPGRTRSAQVRPDPTAVVSRCRHCRVDIVTWTGMCVDLKGMCK